MDDLQTVVGVSKDRCEFLGSIFDCKYNSEKKCIVDKVGPENYTL